jgi:hypothetical protein
MKSTATYYIDEGLKKKEKSLPSSFVFYLLSFFLFLTFQLSSQNVSINANGDTPDPSAMLDVSDTTKGILIPRLTVAQRNLIANPATGLLIFQTNSDSGFYFNQGIPAAPNWLKLVTSTESSTTIKDADNDTKIQVEKVNDEDFIRFDVNGNETMTIDSLGNVIIGSYPTISYHKFGVSSSKLGGLFRLNQETDTLGAEISFLNQENFKWSLGAADDAFEFGESFYLYNNDRSIMDLFVDGDNGNVGFGTTSPEGTLHLYGSGALGAGSRLVFGDDFHSTTGQVNSFVGEGGWMNNSNSDELQIHARTGMAFTVGGQSGVSSIDSALLIYSNGNVVVGDSSLGQKFSIYTKGLANNLLRMQADTGQIGLWYTNDSSNWALFSDQTIGSAIPQGAFGIYGGKVGEPNGVRMVIDKDGNFGVNTIAPVDQFQVGSFTTPQDQFLSIKTGGGNLYKSGIRLLNFADDDGFTLVSDETQNKFFIQSHGGDTTNVLTIDRLTNNIGIGTETPAFQLSIGPSDDDTGFETNSDGNLSLFTNGTERVRFDENGNVGINTTNPRRTLHVNTTSGTSTFANFTTAATGSSISDGMLIGYADNVGAGIFNYENSNLAFGTNNSYRMYLDPNGRLGIGVALPEGALSLNSNAVPGVPAIFFDAFSALEGEIAVDNGEALNIGEWDEATSTFTENMRIMGSGRVGINETAPNAMLSIGTDDTDLTSGINLNNGGDDWYIFQDATQDLVFRDDGTDRVQFTSAGNITLSGSTIHTSDKRLKTNIEVLENVLPKILQLKGVTHYWDTVNYSNRGFTSKRTIGVIAQDIQKVYPELVHTDKSGFLAVDYTKFTAVLLQAIKEQQILIDQQNQNNERQQYEIDYLKEELNQLKQMISDEK